MTTPVLTAAMVAEMRRKLVAAAPDIDDLKHAVRGLSVPGSLDDGRKSAWVIQDRSRLALLMAAAGYGDSRSAIPALLDWISAAVPLLRIAHDAVVSAADTLAADPEHDPVEAAMLESDRRNLVALLAGFPEPPA